MARFTYELASVGFNKQLKVYDGDRLIYTGEPSGTAPLSVLISVAANALTDKVKVSVEELKKMEPRQKAPAPTTNTNTNTNNTARPGTPTNTTQPGSTSTSAPLPFQELKIGSRGDNVSKVQTKLKIKVDGIFGTQTLAAVKAFQTDNQLTPNGVVDDRTWRRMFPEVAVVNTGTTNRNSFDPSTFRGPISATSSVINQLRNNNASPTQSALRNSLNSKFQKQLDNLKNKALSAGLDITKYLLPDEEIAKNFLRDLNPSLSPEDLNIMVYGVTYNPILDIAGNVKSIGEQLQNAANNAAQQVQNVSQQVSSAATNAANQVQSNVQQIQNNVTQQAQNAAQQLQGDITNAAQQLGSDVTSTAQSLNGSSKKYNFEIKELDDKYEVQIKYRRFDDILIDVGTKTIPKDYTEVINGATVSGKENLGKVLQNEATTKGFFGFLKDEVKLPQIPQSEDIRQKANAIEDEATSRLDELRRFTNFAPYPLPKWSSLYKTVDVKKKEFVDMINKFAAHQQEVFNALIASLSQTSSAIPAIALLVSTPPFNVPAAISLGTLVMSAINELVAKVPPILDYIRHLQNLSLYVSRKAYQELVRILNPMVELLTRLLDPISVLKKFIQKIIDALKKLFTSKNCDKQIKRINRELRRKNKALKNEKDEDEKADLKEEVAELEQRLQETKKNCSKGLPIEQDIKDLNQVLNDANELSANLLSAVEEKYVYDVTLPDGQTLLNVTEEEVEALKKVYNVIIE